ncbi:MAG TPA: glycosyltransferase [Vicinamibacteria bacterium]|nr:glycosyltransferase [Vicinamibacteria bacterium]
MTREITVVAPCYNEEGNIPELVQRLLDAFDHRSVDGEIVLVDDGSMDGTASAIRRAAQRDGRVRGVFHAENRGIEAAWRSGVETARGRFVCFIDADLQYVPEDVPRLYRELLHSNADMVQGYRSSIGRLRNSRYTLSKFLNFLLNASFGMRLRDNKSGFVMALRDTMADALRHRFRYAHFQTFITVSAASKGYSIAEMETLFESRLVGKSFIPRFPVKLIAQVLLDLAKAFTEFRLFPRRESLLASYLRENPPARAPEAMRGWRKALFDLYFALAPAHMWMISRQARVAYQELSASQWLSPGQIREVQDIKLRRVIRHAYHHVPYYREAMDERGLTPSDIRTVGDLRELPLLTKEEIRRNIYFDLLSRNHDKRRMLKVHTSGSTGEPFFCYADQEQLETRWAATLRGQEWTGYRFGDRQARLWHQTIGMSWTQVVRERLNAALSRRLFIPAYQMSKATLPRSLARLRRFSPVLIDGYAESFNLLARYVSARKGAAFPVRAVMSSAQILPESSRIAIEEAFGCEVFDKYGSREFSGIAYECEAHAGYHVVAESYVVEILKDGEPVAPGELGEVVITDLTNLSMPLIRYRIGDLAEAVAASEPCPCGRGLPRMGRIEGRVQAIIVTSEGTYLPGTFFAHFFKDYDHLVRQYQVVQSEPDRIQLRIVKGLRFTDGEFALLLRRLAEHLGRGTGIDVSFVDEIPLGRTGKHQGSLSQLEIDFQEGGGALTRKAVG